MWQKTLAVAVQYPKLEIYSLALRISMMPLLATTYGVHCTFTCNFGNAGDASSRNFSSALLLLLSFWRLPPLPLCFPPFHHQEVAHPTSLPPSQQTDREIKVIIPQCVPSRNEFEFERGKTSVCSPLFCSYIIFQSDIIVSPIPACPQFLLPSMTCAEGVDPKPLSSSSSSPPPLSSSS